MFFSFIDVVVHVVKYVYVMRNVVWDVGLFEFWLLFVVSLLYIRRSRFFFWGGGGFFCGVCCEVSLCYEKCCLGRMLV